MINNLIEKDYAKIILLLIASPEVGHSREEIKEKVNLNNSILDSALRTMLSLEILNLTQEAYSLNQDNHLVKYILKDKDKFVNIPLKIQYVLLEFTEKIYQLKNIRKTILFGNYSTSVFTDKSDIDIAVIFSDKVKEKTQIEDKIIEHEYLLSKKYNHNIQTHFFKIH
jgi:predicted nucleotidyltransferase